MNNYKQFLNMRSSSDIMAVIIDILKFTAPSQQGYDKILSLLTQYKIALNQELYEIVNGRK